MKNEHKHIHITTRGIQIGSITKKETPIDCPGKLFVEGIYEPHATKENGQKKCVTPAR